MSKSLSDKTLYRLADSTFAEPLINSWSVWSDTISPVPSSMHLLHYQIKTLSSYLANPEIHVKACRNPRFVGGPFVDIPVERAGEVKQLLADTANNQSDKIKLAQAVTAFYNYLSKEAKGQSLESFYHKLPDELLGYVELLYDYGHHPTIRFLESLLYEGPYYEEENQSLRISRQFRDDGRPFFLSTPRLHEDHQINWKSPFCHPQVDQFFKLDLNPQPLGTIREIIGLEPSEELRLLPFLSQDYRPPAEKWVGGGIRIRYFGHACVLIEWGGISILTDPWITVTPEEGGIDRLTYKDLPAEIDFALITHGHHDHFELETLLRLRHRIKCLVVPQTHNMFYGDPSLKLMAEKLGFKSAIELSTLESIKLPDAEILAVPFLGEHADLAHGKTAYVIRVGRQRILFAADSNCLDKRLYEHVARITGPIETVFLGMECVGAPLSWLYGSLLPIKLQHSYDQTRRTRGCDSAAAQDLLQTVGGNRLYIYAMGREPWLQYKMGLALSDDSIQAKESNLTLNRAREQGFIDAQRPFGKLDIFLNGHK